MRDLVLSTIAAGEGIDPSAPALRRALDDLTFRRDLVRDIVAEFGLHDVLDPESAEAKRIVASVEAIGAFLRGLGPLLAAHEASAGGLLSRHATVELEDDGLTTGSEPVVVVETDAAQLSYDPRLKAMLDEAEHAHEDSAADATVTAALPFPREHRLPDAVVKRDYALVVADHGNEPRWHFQLQLPRSARMEVRDDVGPSEARPTASLAKFSLSHPMTEIEVVGHWLSRDAQPADWLDGWLEQLGVAALSSRPMATERGILGDVVATWSTVHGTFAGRFATRCFGRRLFVIILRCPVAHYRSTVQAHVLALASFEPNP
ncbi:MAG: hypothetical protein ABIP94_08655 [Planctomycetota bacterium]